MGGSVERLRVALFGLGRLLEPPGGYVLYYLLASGYQPPEILRLIATDRSQPYTHYERKRTRNRWRFNDELHGPVYKTTYVRREYAVGSDQGGVLQPIQQHSWDVTWAVPDPRGVQNTLFTLNPHSSISELQTYFVFAPDNAVEAVVRSKKTYDSPDKFLGGSPYEKIFQDQDTVIALYDIPRGTVSAHQRVLLERPQRSSGRCVRLDFPRGGDALIACRLYSLTHGSRLREAGDACSAPNEERAIVQVAARSEFASMDAFAAPSLGFRSRSKWVLSRV